MDQYSQHHLKRAATEPEHVMRKAEFDLAVESLDGRIETIEKTLDVRPGFSGGVMSSRSGIETFGLNDDLSIPSATFVSESSVLSDEVDRVRIMPLSGNLPPEQVSMKDGVSAPSALTFRETSSLSDDIRHVKTAPVFGKVNDEALGLNDAVSSPQSESLMESTGIAESVQSINIDPKRGQASGESLLMDDAARTMNSKGANMENLKMQGEIEVVLEDRSGNVKRREIVTNTITEPYERYVFYDMLNTGTLSALLRSNIRSGFNFLTRTLPTAFGIYALSSDIDLKKNTYLPPYVGNDETSLAPNVSFYNIGGSMSESTMEMIPVDQRCFFDKAKKEYVFEFVKNTGVGTVKSVCVGRSHANKADKFSVALAETAVPATWPSGTTNYLLEHTSDRTFLWKTNGSSASWRNDLLTRSTENISGSNVASTVSSHFGGLVVGNVVYKAAKQSASGGNHVVRLTYVNNFRNTTAAGTKDITFSAPEGMTANTSTTPVMVMRPDLKKLEIFLTTSIGEHDGVFGCNIQKAVIGNLDDPANLSVEIVDLGLLPQAISGATSVAVGYYLTGFFHEGKYYLPFHSVTDAYGNTVTTADSAHQTGIVISSDFSTIHNSVNFRTAAANEVNAFVLTDGGVVQCRVNSTTIPYVHLSQVVSGSNLPQPVTKTVDDVLRIIYRYKLL